MNNLREVRFGLMGLGSIAKVHAKALQNLENAKLVAVTTRNRDKGETFAKEFSCDYYAEYNDLLKREDVDAVIITLPSGLHAKAGIEAAKYGKHVIVEKPIDINLQNADALINECEKQHVLLSVVFQRRFSDAALIVKKAIEESKFGILNFGAAHVKWYRDQDYYSKSGWRGTWELDGGGALINQAIHYVDLLRFLVGEIEEVFAYSAIRMHKIEVEDILSGTIKFKNGALGLVEANTAAYPGLYSRLDIYGEKGLVVVVDDEIETLKIDQCNYEERKNLKNKSQSLHQRQLKDIIDSILECKKPSVTGIDARNTLAVVMAFYESVRTHKPQQVEIISC